MFPDGVHPIAAGAKLMAVEVHCYLKPTFSANRWVYDSCAGYFGNNLPKLCVLTVRVLAEGVFANYYS